MVLTTPTQPRRLPGTLRPKVTPTCYPLNIASLEGKTKWLLNIPVAYHICHPFRNRRPNLYNGYKPKFGWLRRTTSSSTKAASGLDMWYWIATFSIVKCKGARGTNDEWFGNQVTNRLANAIWANPAQTNIPRVISKHSCTRPFISSRINHIGSSN